MNPSSPTDEEGPTLNLTGLLGIVGDGGCGAAQDRDDILLSIVGGDKDRLVIGEGTRANSKVIGVMDCSCELI